MRGVSRYLVTITLLAVLGCRPPQPCCPLDGPETLFVADFESAAVGAPPPATGYGPPQNVYTERGMIDTKSIQTIPVTFGIIF